MLSAAMALAASAAWAGGADHPDLPDVSSYFTSTDNSDNYAYIRQEGDRNNAYGYVSASTGTSSSESPQTTSAGTCRSS